MLSFDILHLWVRIVASIEQIGRQKRKRASCLALPSIFKPFIVVGLRDGHQVAREFDRSRTRPEYSTSGE
jgi:hypothetical protein